MKKKLFRERRNTTEVVVKPVEKETKKKSTKKSDI